ncbi:bifunctional diguanylate cyclase/phosphodiesterase [Roseovarius amoyensis]|uniref:EAL domain-containing protein n=1 Tax=Roseovarius amoyensis TaxID=2211448 RepID=UPI000DBE190D|nr:bifunctional diguanylate cyclase/phosphodiesterase [Roseovarius amoyensis]
MIRRLYHSLFSLRRRAAALLTGPMAVALLPVVLFLGHRVGGEDALALATLAVPAALLLAGAFGRHRRGTADIGPPVVSGRSLRQALDAALGHPGGGMAACIMLQMDDHDRLRDGEGLAAAALADHVALHLQASLRRRDRIFFLGGGPFGIVPAPARRMTADALWQMGARLQEGSQRIDGKPGAVAGFSVCIGIAMAAVGRDTGKDLMAAAAAALAEARETAPATICLRRSGPKRGPVAGPRPLRLHDEAVRALEGGEITAWFQPQLCTDTGRVSGFEALARWCHPQRGVLAPARFLPYLERAGLAAQLQEVILRDALGALGKWRALGFGIPSVGVNFSPVSLRDPALADAIAWELDRHDLPASCLTVEILEAVVSVSPDDATARNIRRLSKMGCRIDLDDFGTGHASISSLRRFQLNRLKIDRSFVRGIDGDPDQQRMVAAILTMAEQLQLDTLAEGVESAGEHALLAQLGCGHVQGFGIARPIPYERTPCWLSEHAAKLGSPPEIGRAMP